MITFTESLICAVLVALLFLSATMLRPWPWFRLSAIVVWLVLLFGYLLHVILLNALAW